MILIIWIDSWDVKEPVRLYGIEFGWVELLKLNLAWTSSFWVSWVEGVLWNGGLKLNFWLSVSVQAAKVRAAVAGWVPLRRASRELGG